MEWIRKIRGFFKRPVPDGDAGPGLIMGEPKEGAGIRTPGIYDKENRPVGEVSPNPSAENAGRPPTEKT